MIVVVEPLDVEPPETELPLVEPEGLEPEGTDGPRIVELLDVPEPPRLIQPKAKIAKSKIAKTNEFFI